LAIEADARVLDAAHVVGVILEGLAILFMPGLFPCASSGDLVVAPCASAWRKLRPTLKRNAGRSGSQKTFEWFQWLAAQLGSIFPGKNQLAGWRA